MKRAMLSVLSLAVALVILGAGTSQATTVSFVSLTNNPATFTYVVNSDLTLSARSVIPAGGNAFTGGVAGGVYIGPLGTMDGTGISCSGGKNCGVGVMAPEYDKSGRFKGFGGSEGISGEGGDADESLIFDFTMGAPGVISSSIILKLVGLNDLLDGTNKNDVVDLTLDYWNTVDQAYGSVNTQITLLNGIGTLNFSTLALNSTQLDRFAVRALEGHFGVTEITYEKGQDIPEIPEPATVTLLGTGLIAVGAGIRRRLRR